MPYPRASMQSQSRSRAPRSTTSCAASVCGMVVGGSQVTQRVVNDVRGIPDTCARELVAPRSSDDSGVAMCADGRAPSTPSMRPLWMRVTLTREQRAQVHCKNREVSDRAHKTRDAPQRCVQHESSRAGEDGSSRSAAG